MSAETLGLFASSDEECSLTFCARFGPLEQEALSKEIERSSTTGSTLRYYTVLIV